MGAGIKIKLYRKEELINFSKEQVIEIYIELQNILLKKIEEFNKPKKNSQNSSKPPSSDPKPNISNKSGKIGAKVGHKGSGYKRQIVVDKKKYYKLDKCSVCNKDLTKEKNVNEIGYQTIDIEIKKVVTEHILETKYCSNCKKYVTVPIDENYPEKHYGDEIRGLILYLHYAQHIPQNRIKELLLEVFNVSISKGAINEILMDLPSNVDEVYERIKEGIKNSEVVGADETGYRKDGKNNWIWIFRNNFLSYFEFSDSRGAKVVREILGDKFTGILISDFYSAYEPFNFKKAKCNGHLGRDIRFWKENSQGEEREFIEDFEKLLYESKNITDNKDEEVKLKHLEKLAEKFQKFKKYKFPKGSSANKLLKRLLKYYDEIFLFIKEKEVPFTNNGSEQDIRKIVIHRKISNCVRSDRGKDSLKKLISIISTLKKQCRNIYENIKLLTTGKNLVILYDTG